MKKLLAILFLLVAASSSAQMFNTDTAKVVDRANQWWTTTYGQTRNVKLRNILYHPSQYAAASLPAGSTGSIIWDTDSLRFRYYNGTEWVLMTPDGGGAVAGVASFNSRTGAVSLLTADVSGVGGFVNGGNTFSANSTIGNISNHALAILTNNVARVNITATGDVSIPGNPLTVGGTVNATINLQNTGASTRGSLEVNSNNPRNNSATGIWNFASSGTNIGSYNATGWFFGGGSAATARVEMLAGTTAVAPFRFNSGPLLTTPLVGAVEFLTDKFYGTITTGTARKEFALWDVAGTSGRVAFETTNGRLTDHANFRYENNELIVGSASDAGSFSLQNTGGLFQSGAVKMDLGSDATGDTYYRDASGNFVRLPTGTDGQVMTLTAGLIPSWADPTGGSSDTTKVTAPLYVVSGTKDTLKVRYDTTTIYRRASDSALTAITLYSANSELADNRIMDGNSNSLSLGQNSSRLSAMQINSAGLIQLFGLVQFNSENASDANYTVSDRAGFVRLVDIATNRVVTLPPQGSGKFLIIWNQNTGANTWSFSGTVIDPAGASITNLANDTVYILISDGTSYVKIN